MDKVELSNYGSLVRYAPHIPVCDTTDFRVEPDFKESEVVLACGGGKRRFGGKKGGFHAGYFCPTPRKGLIGGKVS